MSELLHAQVLEQKRQKELQERNLNAKRRLQEIASGNQTQWSGNIKDLKNVTKVAESILSIKDLNKEYEYVLSKYDIMAVKMLNNVRDDLLSKYHNDPFYVRLLTAYTELLGDEVKRATLKQLDKKQKISPVTFYGENKKK